MQQKSRYLLLAFLEGFTVIGLELSAHMVVAPLFGSSIIIWVIVLATTSISLATGYFWASKTRSDNVFLILMPLFFLWINFIIFLGEDIVLWLQVIDNFYVSGLVSILILFLIPLTILGTIPVFLIKEFEKTGNPGQISSKIFTLSTIGAVSGVYLFGFGMIPEWGVKLSIYFAGLIFTIGGLFVIKNLKVKTGLTIITFVSVIFLTMNHTTLNKEIIYQSEGLLGQILVADINASEGTKEKDRLLFVNRMGQTWIDANKESRWGYVNFTLASISDYPSGAKVLLLGLGGGTVAQKMYDFFRFKVDAVELDGRIGKVAKEHFLLRNYEDIIIDDARHYLEKCDKKYDIIVFDLFKGEVAPSHVLSLESFLTARKLLNNGGLMVINFNGFISGEKGKVGRSLAKTLRAAGMFVKILPTIGEEKDRNNLFLATTSPKNFKKNKLVVDGEEISIEDLFLQTPTDLDAFIFNDDTPRLEYLNAEMAHDWRKSYIENFQDKLDLQEIPIFK